MTSRAGDFGGGGGPETSTMPQERETTPHAKVTGTVDVNVKDQALSHFFKMIA